MSSTVISNPVTNSERSKRKKKKKFSQSKHQNNNILRWKSEAQQQIYSSKLILALNQLTITNISSTSASGRGRAVREAANRALAVAAKGTTRWSRAILTNRLKLKFRKQKSHRVLSPSSSSVVATGSSRSKKTRFSVLKLKRSLPTVQRKVRVLGRLVPGCRKQPLPVILDEASDYTAALEMQVRAMTAIAELLSGGGGSTSSSPSTS
ncbi:transcription factor bHLH147-like [Mangifera indica]|uniref:transcription factor bHLH147-like n=1 Tax=Mangifera indica TaxID=29780 RepID=UPI001CF95384|nr:transcription factor bHLH147-like [Mangifera indica]